MAAPGTRRARPARKGGGSMALALHIGHTALVILELAVMLLSAFILSGATQKLRLPNVTDRLFIICDPMLATGYSAAHAVDVLKKRGVSGESIRFLALVSAPEGIAVMQQLHPDIEIYVASLDEKLDENAYIVPGLGDAGDRLFGTK